MGLRVLMTGGGTGGHVNPALAIANTIKQNVEGSVIEYVGTSRGIENKLVPRAGYKLHHVEIRGLRRSLSLSNLKTAYYVLTSPAKAGKLIASFKPDIVIGTGGYVCWPVIKAAADRGIPTVLHESNAIPGVAVKMLASKVDRIYLNFEKAGENLSCKEKLLHVGNPLLAPFSGVSLEEAKKKAAIPEGCKYFLLSYGGSLGAQKVNEAVIRLMKEFTSKHPEVYHLHATGSIEHETATAMFKEAGLDKCENIKLVEYIYDMPVQMAAADLIICRAGAMTVSELSMSGKCAVFIPSPNVTDNHQYKNAKVLADAGAAVVFEEKELTDDRLERKIEELLCEKGDAVRTEMSEKIGAFSVKDANKLIFNDILDIIEKKKK
ncbi:MAG: undecaprenyldiphospho-muramoylpentapeptide beta-N-acetylglucosaminyltransferase [Ruminococcaceae bacterium]|nr:undecaprenyldiphospho-muramoylpentapeptide beta-N-acetylglucosaminyltransferase [Oscillospiraceae bacterium]